MKKFQYFTHYITPFQNHQKEKRELNCQIKELLSIDSGLAQPDHSQSEFEAKENKAARRFWEKQAKTLRKSIKTALGL